MYKRTPRRTTTSPVASSISRSRLRRSFRLIPLLLALASFFALAVSARAVTPAPDGGYPNQNTAEGQDALFSLTASGTENTAIGFAALHSNTTGSYNTANGAYALFSNKTGNYNTANGRHALISNTTGGANAADGFEALGDNTTGSFNTANGLTALGSNTTGSNNTANGYQALIGTYPSTGSNNTANGVQALFSNKTGIANTANGVSALRSNTTGGFNTANGVQALNGNTTGGGNTANGNFALFSNTVGSSNTAEGFDALFNNTTGSRNIALGLGAGGNLTTGNDNVDIGNVGVAGESNKIRIGKTGTHTGTFIAGISGVAVTGTQVVVNASGKLGVTASSARFKEAIKPMDKASEAILALQPVTFHYKHQVDPEGMPQFGLVAEQVEKVNPDLVVRDHQGKVYTVRYEAVNAMLLNEFLKEHRTVEELKATVGKQEATITQLNSAVAQQQKDFQSTTAQQEKEIKALTASFKEQALQIQKVGS